MKKKIIAAILLATLTVSMIGCGNNSNTSGKDTSTVTINDNSENTEKTENTDITDNSGNTENNKADEKVTEPGSDRSDYVSYVPEYVRNMDCSKFDESLKPVQVKINGEWANITDALATNAKGWLYGVGYAFDISTDKKIPDKRFDHADYVISLLGQPSGICVSNFITSSGDTDEKPVKKIVLIYEYSDYILMVNLQDMRYDDELTNVIDTAYTESVHIVTRETFENEIKNKCLVFDATTNDTPIATYGTLEGFVPVAE